MVAHIAQLHCHLPVPARALGKLGMKIGLQAQAKNACTLERTRRASRRGRAERGRDAVSVREEMSDREHA